MHHLPPLREYLVRTGSIQQLLPALELANRAALERADAQTSPAEGHRYRKLADQLATVYIQLVRTDAQNIDNQLADLRLQAIDARDEFEALKGEFYACALLILHRLSSINGLVRIVRHEIDDMFPRPISRRPESVPTIASRPWRQDHATAEDCINDAISIHEGIERELALYESMIPFGLSAPDPQGENTCAQVKPGERLHFFKQLTALKDSPELEQLPELTARYLEAADNQLGIPRLNSVYLLYDKLLGGLPVWSAINQEEIWQAVQPHLNAA